MNMLRWLLLALCFSGWVQAAPIVHVAPQHFAGAVTTDVSRGPIQGVRSTIEVQAMSGGIAKAAWTAVRIGQFWIQAGYWGKSNRAFEMCFTTPGGSSLNLPYCPNRIVLNNEFVWFNVGEYPVFEIKHVGGGSWVTSWNGVPVIQHDLGVETANYAQINIEQTSTELERLARFPVVDFHPAMELFEGGEWGPAKSAIVVWTEANWGVEGALQNPSLEPNQVLMGTQIEVLPVGTLLWDTP